MKKILILFVLISASVIGGMAKSRTQNEALAIANSFLQKTPTLRSGETHEALTLAYICQEQISTRSLSENPYYYVFNINTNDGFVIIGGDDRTKDILGYSYNGAFDINNIPENFKNWLSYYQEEIRLLSDDVIQSGNNQEVVEKQLRASFASTIAPLLGGIKWDQEDPYNALCPVIPVGKPNAGKKTATGCVATAMAQIMKYHQWPAQGTGSKSYQSKDIGLNLSANFGQATYNWGIMTDTYSTSSTQAQKDEVAKLMFHCGVAVEMNYNTSSGASQANVAIALPKYFNYDKNATSHSRDFYSRTEWINMIKTELNAKRPVLYSGHSSGGGHTFVCDGYDNNGLFHFNWGWSGSSNGYFELSALNPSILGTGGGSGGYNNMQSIVIGIQKPTGSSTPTHLAKVGYKLFEVGNDKINLNESFAINIGYIMNIGITTFTGNFGVALYDESDNYIQNVHTFYSTGITGLPPDSYYENIAISSAKLPSSLKTGKYRLRLIYGSNRVFMERKAGVVPYIKVNVSGQTVTFSKPSDDLPQLFLNSLNTVGNIYKGKKGNFSAEITNTGNGEYNSDLILQLQAKSSGKIINISEPVVIAAKEAKIIEFSRLMTDVTPGEYTMLLLYDTGNTGEALTTSRAAILGSKIFNVLNTPVGTPILTLVEKISFTGGNTKVYKENAELRAKVKNTGGYFEGYVNSFVFSETSDNSLTYLGLQNISIDAGETKEIIFKGTIDIDPGSYEIGVYYHNGLTYAKFIEQEPLNSWTYFNLYEGFPSSIEQNLSIDKIKLYPNPVTDILYLESEEVVKSINIIDISGKLITNIIPNINGVITIPLEGINPGTYIIQYKTNDDVKTKKFIKK